MKVLEWNQDSRFIKVCIHSDPLSLCDEFECMEKNIEVFSPLPVQASGCQWHEAEGCACWCCAPARRWLILAQLDSAAHVYICFNLCLHLLMLNVSIK